jgi:hypothetical protein
MIATGFFDDFLGERFIVWSKNGRKSWETSSQKKTVHQKQSNSLGKRQLQLSDPMQEKVYSIPPELGANFWLGGPCLQTHR